jgi:GntR family transcriptional regulator / MocR family aminotransferase
MTDTWAISGVDLHLELGGPRVRAGLEDALRDALRSGRLRPGARLPSSRSLAADLGIARNTVADAYGQLVAEGWLVARQGSGTRVADRAPAGRVATATATAAPGESAPATSPRAPLRYDLRSGFPDLAAFPRSAWLAASRRALTGAPFDALGYGDPRGRPELRRALADYLARARGVRVTPERVVVCAGFTQGLALLCEVLRTHGASRLAVEAHSHPPYRELAVARGLALRPLPVDEHGAAVAELGDADAALLTPAHQYPVGVPLAPQRRTEAVDWAARGDRLIVEDDYDGEFRYDRQPLGAMQALAPDHVVYAGTASKTLAPALRLGWLVLPERVVDDVAAARAQLISSGAYDRHVRRSRLAYRRRRDRLVAVLHHHAPTTQVTGIAAGLHAVVRMPDGAEEDAVVARAAEHGLAVEGLDAYRAAGPRAGPALVVGYGTPPEHAFTAALARLAAVLAAAC